MLPEYDFSGGVRGKYYDQYRGGTNVILELDVAAAFPDSASVNRALRLLADVARKQITRSANGGKRKSTRFRRASRRSKRT
jgi:hypothetical protein